MKKHLPIVISVFLILAGSLFAENKNITPTGGTVFRTGDSFNGKVITFEGILTDPDLGVIANLFIKEIRDGKVVTSYLMTARESSILSVGMPNNDSGVSVYKFEITEIGIESLTTRSMNPFEDLPKSQILDHVIARQNF